jgi:NAD(P)-dependent dehydrogenase (short-subunit alcohol dehydrogenase family)
VTRFGGKVAVVTAGASGIGESVVRGLVAQGARVVIGDIDIARASALQRELGDGVVAARCDVTEEDGVARLVEQAVDRFGRLDLGFNVAGGGGGGRLVETDAAAWRDCVDLCLTSAFYGVKHQALRMIVQGDGGAIVNVASMNAQIPVYGVGAYCCAKAGVEMLTKVAALELGEHRIRVNVVSPGHTVTPMTESAGRIPGFREAYLTQTPLRRIAQPDEIADAMLFLASDEARHISGVALLVDGGYTLATHFDMRPFFHRDDA